MLLRLLTNSKSGAALVFRPVLAVVLLCLSFVTGTMAQQGATQQSPRKSNERPADAAAAPPQVQKKREPFDNASGIEMGSQCVTLETESGVIVIEMLADAAPETVRNFLNLAATGALDTTTFSRVVKGFVIQGGNLATSERWGAELSERARRTIQDEPNYVKHLRGVVSMARPEKPNGASTHFFILVAEAPTLDGKFAAFGRVTSGMEVVDAINNMPVEGEKPVKPVRLRCASVAPCVK